MQKVLRHNTENIKADAEMCLPLIMEVNMKVERFITEYANSRKRNIIANDLMKENFKADAIAKIDGAVRARERGIITVDETIRLILECFEK